mgnify:CR=1 FL=1
MKADIHPKFQTINFICACGATYVAGSTMTEDFQTEVCSACHPFYTGKQKLLDSSGRVDKFVARMKKAVPERPAFRFPADRKAANALIILMGNLHF